MFYLFNHMTGDAQKYLQPGYDDDAQARFVLAKEMLELLAIIFVNLN